MPYNMKNNSSSIPQRILFFFAGKWAFSIVFTILFFYVFGELSKPFFDLESIPIQLINQKLDIIKELGQQGWQKFKTIYLVVSLIGIFLSGFIIYRAFFENFISHKKDDTHEEIVDAEIVLPEFPWNKDKLQMIVGVKHTKQNLEKIKYPSWVVVPEKGMFQNFLISGGIGMGKTSCVMYPCSKQAIFYKAHDRDHKAGGLFLDVKGNFFEKILEFAKECGRQDDIILIKLGGEYKYNPLHKPHMEAIDLAERSRIVMDLFSGGAKKEAFWDTKSAQMMCECIRLMRMVNDGYVTLGDVHRIVTDESFLDEKINLLYEKEGELNAFDFNSCSSYFSGEFTTSKAVNTIDTIKACVTEMTAFFASSERIFNSFCPPKEKGAGDASKNFYGFRDVIDEGKIVVLAMNVQEYPKVSKTIAAYLKLDFQSEIIQRTVPENNLNRTRPMFFISDEYQEFVTANDGDFYGLSREARCCSIVSSQSYTSILKTLGNDKAFNTMQQNLVNKIWLRSDDKFTIDTAQLLTGKEEKEKVSKNISESASDTKRSKLFGRLVSDKQNISEGITVSLQKDFVFDEKVFTQVVEMNKAICFLAHEKGMQEPSIVHLLPFYETPISDKIFVKPVHEKKNLEKEIYMKL